MKLTHHQYGKARVRVMKVSRDGARHSLKELEVSVMLVGDFDASYTEADNSLVVPTDTMKNTVNIFAKEKLGAENEEFGVALGEHFLKTYPQVQRAEIELIQHCWERMYASGKPHDHSFIGGSSACPFARIVCAANETQVTSGIDDLLILKSTGSGFADYVKDKFTTLPEAHDRILATKLRARWTYSRKPKSYSTTNTAILEAMLDVFATQYSASVQATLYQMGEAALKIAPEISKITLTMPNQHCLLINLTPFGLQNQNELFVPTTEPHGLIEGTVERD